MDPSSKCCCSFWFLVKQKDMAKVDFQVLDGGWLVCLRTHKLPLFTCCPHFSSLHVFSVVSPDLIDMIS